MNSQVFDHTSLIQFIEARFAPDHLRLIEPNITPWRRAVAGDLTSAFDFRKPNGWKRLVLPVTTDFRPEDFVRVPDEEPVPPDAPEVPEQEPGVRPARALPYELEVSGRLRRRDGSFRLTFINAGHQAAVFHVRSANSAQAPRTYTVEAGKQLSDWWDVTGIGSSSFDLSVYGPNGFARTFTGSVVGAASRLEIFARYDDDRGGISLDIANLTNGRDVVRVLDTYSGKTTEVALDGADSATRHWFLSRTHGWYGLVVTVDAEPSFSYEFAGHVENGKDSISDPAMGGLV